MTEIMLGTFFGATLAIIVAPILLPIIAGVVYLLVWFLYYTRDKLEVWYYKLKNYLSGG